ncbi:MAG: hypothetical protein LUQ66_04945 [Methanoregula sp.]|nr:hypothetical protein [Methanoregula sp.]
METAIVILLIVAIVSGGCINKFTQKPAEPEQTPGITLEGTYMAEDAPTLPTRTSPVSQSLVVEMIPVKSEVVKVVTPILTPDPYPVLHANQINSTPSYNRLDRSIEFEKKYHLTGGAEGLLVNVAEGPLYIVYVVTPQNDCLNDVCRGDKTKPVQRPYLKITVRDNLTHEIVAEDGYGYEYSSDTGKQKITEEITHADGSTETYTGPTIPRYIPVYKEGTFHITIEGAYLDAEVKILTGAMPSRLDTETSTDSTTSYTSVYSDETFG